MPELSKEFRFLAGIVLICVSRMLPALVLMLSGRPWYYPVIGSLLFVTFGYCAWRGERWAYYLLMFLNILGCALGVMVIISPPDSVSLPLRIFMLATGVGGALLLALSEDTHKFMASQRKRFASEAHHWD